MGEACLRQFRGLHRDMVTIISLPYTSRALYGLACSLAAHVGPVTMRTSILIRLTRLIEPSVVDGFFECCARGVYSEDMCSKLYAAHIFLHADASLIDSLWHLYRKLSRPRLARCEDNALRYFLQRF